MQGAFAFAKGRPCRNGSVMSARNDMAH